MGWFDHYSMILIITGLLHMGLLGVRSAKLPETHFVKRYGENAVSIALFPTGIVQMISVVLYLYEVLIGTRPVALLNPYVVGLPGWVGGWVLTGAYAGTMIGGAVSATGQAGRKVPWSVVTGGVFGGIGGGSTLLTALAFNTPLNIAAVFSGLITLAVFVFMFFVTLPGENVAKLVGEVSAYSPTVLVNSFIMVVLGSITGMGWVIL